MIKQGAQDQTQQHRIVLVTGPSGAGRSTAINALEDLGYEAIDNLPLSLIPQAIENRPGGPLAIGLDVRNRDFSVDGVLAAFRELAGRAGLRCDMLYLDCTTEVLIRRYSETRRRHPLAPDSAPEVGVEEEHRLLAPLKSVSTIVLDTSELTPHELRDAVGAAFGSPVAGRMAISVHSFSYKRGVPQGADLVFDCRFLANPHWEPSLRAKDGRDSGVAAYVEADPRWAKFVENIRAMMELLLPAFREEGKSHLLIAFGCTGGKHRSVAMVESLANWLANQGWQASKRHRELDRQPKAWVPQVRGSV